MSNRSLLAVAPSLSCVATFARTPAAATAQRGARPQARMTNREASTLERGQALRDRHEAAAGASGHVGKVAQRDVQRSENRQGARIEHLRHDGPVRG